MISIIVPCFNAERVLPRCIDSLLKQTYQDFELLLVNDGSGDGTLACMQRYCQKDNRISLIDLGYNRGLGQARFAGILAAKGEWITFSDADDWMPPHALESLFLSAEKTQADIVEGAIARVLGKTGIIRRVPKKQTALISGPELFDNYYISFFGINLLSVNLCGKLYRRTLFSAPGVKASEFVMGEDLILNMRVFPFVQKYAIIPDVVYYYRIGGMTSHYNKHFYPDLKAQYYLKLDTIQKYGYSKAINPTKIEMCNVLCSQVKQMLLYRKDKEKIVSFLQEEIDSGFVDEISSGIQYPSALLLAGKDIGAIIASQQNGLWKARLRKAAYSLFKS